LAYRAVVVSEILVLPALKVPEAEEEHEHTVSAGIVPEFVEEPPISEDWSSTFQ